MYHVYFIFGTTTLFSNLDGAPFFDLNQPKSALSVPVFFYQTVTPLDFYFGVCEIQPANDVQVLGRVGACLTSIQF